MAGWDIGPSLSFTPRGKVSRFSNFILFIPSTHLSYIGPSRRYSISVCNESGNESVSPGTVNTLAITAPVFVTNWRKRGYLEAVSTLGQDMLLPRISKAPAKPWPGPATKPHVHLRVSNATASLCYGKILIRILTHTVHIHPTRREGGIFSQFLTID